MSSIKNLIEGAFFHSWQRTLMVLGGVVMAIALPATILLTQQQQDLRQRAESLSPLKPTQVMVGELTNGLYCFIYHGPTTPSSEFAEFFNQAVGVVNKEFPQEEGLWRSWSRLASFEPSLKSISDKDTLCVGSTPVGTLIFSDPAVPTATPTPTSACPTSPTTASISCSGTTVTCTWTSVPNAVSWNADIYSIVGGGQ